MRGTSRRDGRRSRRTAANEDGRFVAYARPDFGGPLGQPFSFAGAADAVSVPQSPARRRLCRTGLRAHRVRGRVRADPGADRISRRPCRRAEDPDRGPGDGRAGADAARPASQLHQPDRQRRAARACQQRLSSGRLRHSVRAYGRGADGPRVFGPHFRRLSGWCGGAGYRCVAGGHGRWRRGTDRLGRGRCARGTAAPDRQRA